MLEELPFLGFVIFLSHSPVNVPISTSHVRDQDVGCASFDKCPFYF